jgi:hypothetical protein
MSKKREIKEPESDGIVLDACLALPEGLRHRHAQAILEKYSEPDELAIEILRAVRGDITNTLRLIRIQNLLYSKVYEEGTYEEKLSLFIEGYGYE